MLCYVMLSAGARSRHGERAAVHGSVCSADQFVHGVYLRLPLVLDSSCLSSQRLQVLTAVGN